MNDVRENNSAQCYKLVNLCKFWFNESFVYYI